MLDLPCQSFSFKKPIPEKVEAKEKPKGAKTDDAVLSGTLSRVLVYQDKYRKSGFTVLDMRVKIAVSGVVGKFETREI